MNTHRAYILVHSANVPTDPHDPNSPTKVVESDEPKHKMIASGPEDFCEDHLHNYKVGHPGVEGGVIETTAAGDPWYREWLKVFS